MNTSKYKVTLIPRGQYHDVSFWLITPLETICTTLHDFYDYVHRAASNNFLLSPTAPQATSNKYAIYLLISKGPEICANENLGIFITSAKPLPETQSPIHICSAGTLALVLILILPLQTASQWKHHEIATDKTSPDAVINLD